MSADTILSWAPFLSASQIPGVQFALIVLATFILEDAATVLAAIAAAGGGLSVPLALAALYSGIVLGDLGLYGLGRLASRVSLLERFIPKSRRRQGRAWLEGRVFSVVFISRFVPGARLPTYTACGFVGGHLGQFALAAVVATSIWTSLLFGVSYKLGALLMPYLGAWRWAGAIGFAVMVVLIGRTAARLQEATEGGTR